MRREILVPLVAFLGGFVVAAMIFWQPSSQSSGTSQEVAPAVVTNGDGVEAMSRQERPQLAAGAAVESQPQMKQPAEVFHDAIGKLNDLDSVNMEGVVKALSNELRAAGPEGTEVLRQYFRAGRDATFERSSMVVDGKMVRSLRTALLDSLQDWPPDVANELALEALRTKPGRADAAVVIRLLEKNAPGVYRAEAIKAVAQLADEPPRKGDWLMNDVIFETMRRFKATELLPVAESKLGNDAFETAKFINALDALPADVRAASLQRLFANESVTIYLPTSTQALQSLNYSDPGVAQGMAQIFATSSDKNFRESLLQGFAQTTVVNFGSRSDRLAKLEARAAFIETIAPQCDTPVLQERLQDARAAVQKAVANPDDDGLTKRGSGTLILSGSNTFIGGATIITNGNIEVRSSGTSK